MSFASSFECEIESEPLVQLYAAPESISSEEVPPEEWESLILQNLDDSSKRYLYNEGLYDPGSGEICTKYIPQSDSAILSHPYYHYPAVKDPGIKEALLDPVEKVRYPDDGQASYLATCSIMDIRPVGRFYQGLLLTDIDLSYYGVRSTWIRAMAMALRYNKNVKTLNLMDNFLDNDACFHLGEMLVANNTIRDLNLSGCRVGDNGLHCILIGLNWNSSVKKLNLDKNKLTDESGTYLAEVISSGISVLNLSLRHNEISANFLHDLTIAFADNNNFRSLDLSWNTLCNPPIKMTKFLKSLTENTKLREVSLSWTALSGDAVAVGLRSLILAPQIRVLNLSNNKLYDQDLKFVNILGKAKTLQTLNLSFNPISAAMALKLINKMLICDKLERLMLEYIDVTPSFIEAMEEVLTLKPTSQITYGRVNTRSKPKGPDMRDLLLNRIEALLTHSKKKPTDIALIALQLLKDDVKTINSQDFIAYVKSKGGVLDAKLIETLAVTFPGSHNAKLTLISIPNLVDFIRRKWPDRQLPPTPPPEVKKKKAKGKKGKKGDKNKKGDKGKTGVKKKKK